MSPIDLTSLGVGFAALRANPLRTVLSTLGVMMGVAALVSVLSVGDGVEQFAREQVSRTTGLQAVLVVSRPTRDVDGIQVPNPDMPRLAVADARALAAAAPAGTTVQLTRTGAGLVSRPDWERPRGALVEARWGEGPGPALAAGRGLAPEADGGTLEAVVSHSLARLVAGGGPIGAALGDSVTVGEVRVAIVGIADSAPGARSFALALPFDLGDRAMAPSDQPRPATLAAVAPTLESVPSLKAAVEAWVAGHDSAWRAGVAVQTQERRLEQAIQGALIFKILMGTIAGVSLLVGGIGIMNVLLAAVAERTREIGIRKAAGARRRDVLLQFLSESVAITGLGSAIGVVLGYAIARLGAGMMRAWAGAPVHAGLSGSTVAVAALASIAVGITFGMYPALRAARLDPIEAIRHE